MAAMAMTGEHPQDVLSRIAEWQAEDRACALVVITDTQGGAVRAPGALLAVSDKSSLGYISGGCIDADVILQARQSLKTKQIRSLRYGAGSPFVDLPLPCGGTIDVLILPDPDTTVISALGHQLASRKPAILDIDHQNNLSTPAPGPSSGNSAHRFVYEPKLRLRIAGRGADALALAKIGDAAGYGVHLQLLDDDDIEDAARADLKNVEQLTTVSGLPDLEDDPWTAFVLLFHDRDWEIPLLKQALSGPAFYIGAVGSKRTHAVRCDELRAASCTESDIARIHGPVGLVPSLRDASAIALSTLAEIVQAASHRNQPQQTKTAFILLAAGASNRYEHGDKLVAEYRGKKILEYAASLRMEMPSAYAIAVTAPDDAARRAILDKAGWTVLENPEARTGQASSLKCALDHITGAPDIDQVIILLGDMPNVPGIHIQEMFALAQDPNVEAIMSESDTALSPPALFKRSQFDALSRVSGDRGAKSIFLDIERGGRTLKLSTREAIDIDCVADLSSALETENA
jgi:xanthine dehydrogenase accessory factor